MTKSKRAPMLTPRRVLDWTGVQTQRVEYEPATMIFGQGDPATSVMYVEMGAVQLSVLSHAGKEAVVALLEAGHFSEGCLAGQTQRMATATAIAQARSGVEKPNGAAAPRPARLRGSFPDAHADEEHPNRRRSRRPALQLHREAARACALAVGAMR